MIKEMFKKKEGVPDEQKTPETPELSAGQETTEPQETSESRETEEPREPETLTANEALENAYCLGAGITPKTLAAAKKILAGLGVPDDSRFNPSALQLALRLLNYDSDMEEARRLGYEAGKAEEIAAAFREKRSKAEEAAAIPRLGGLKKPLQRAESIFDVARGDGEA